LGKIGVNDLGIWLNIVHHQVRIETGSAIFTCAAPEKRFQPEARLPLPPLDPTIATRTEALIHQDLRLTFDGNRYYVPPRCAGHKLTVKSDSSSVTIYDQAHEVVRFAQCWG
jgi:hypothetical protein